MKMNRWLAVLVFLAMAGCSTIPVGPGEKPDAVAPKIRVGSDQSRTWDRPRAFGPVPASLEATGNQVCGQGMKAIGYHPEAQDENGKPFPAGGYLCVPNK
jgi:hypothetical protein